MEEWKESSLGVIEYEVIGEVVFVEWFEVYVKMRGNGRKLWKEFESEMLKRGMKRVCVESYRGNEEFWEKMGFEFEVDEKGERVLSSNGYCMSKKIEDSRLDNVYI